MKNKIKKILHFILFLLITTVTFSDDIYIEYENLDTGLYRLQEIDGKPKFMKIRLIVPKQKVRYKRCVFTPSEEIQEFSIEENELRGIKKRDILNYNTIDLSDKINDSFSFLVTFFINARDKLQDYLKYYLGKLYKDDGTYDDIYVVFDKDNFIAPLIPLKLEKKSDLNLGVCMAGETLDKNSKNYSPAVIEITGAENEKVAIYLNGVRDDIEVPLKNDRNDVMTAKVFIPREEDMRPNGGHHENPKKYWNKVKGKDKKTYNMTYVCKIHGECKTNINSSGKYKGSFKVRVEYSKKH